MKPIRLLAAGMGVLACQAALATDKVGTPVVPSPNVTLPSFEEDRFPAPADVAHRVGIVGLHIVAAAGIALSVMSRRRRAR